MNPEPDIATVLREFAMVWSVTGLPASAQAPLVRIVSARSNVAKSNRCPKTKTLLAISPPPPTIGLLWQPEQELVSGPETRLKFRGNIKGSLESESGAPVPLVSGRPPPSWLVHMAVKSSRPCEINCRVGI